MDKPKIIVICGPTATGKTAAAVALCEALGGEAVSADSMQVYRTLDVGTAKPSKDEMHGIPHHLIDIREPNETFSVSDFVECAAKAITDITARSRVPVVVGGTGLYLSALLSGTKFDRGEPEAELRASLAKRAEDEGADAMHELLREIDPVSAHNIHPSNMKRVLRALEYYYSAGEPISRQVERSKTAETPYDATVVYLDYAERESLYSATDARVDAMMSQGLLDEAKYVYDNRHSFITAAQSIGYKEFFNYLESKDSLDAAVELLKQRTRNFAKRQISWFKRMKIDVRLDVKQVSENKTLLSTHFCEMPQKM